MSKRKNSKHPDLQWEVGTKVSSKRYGAGVVTDINPYDPEFHYNVSFEDGTKLWYDGRSTSVITEESE